jgi:hypothetical protein
MKFEFGLSLGFLNSQLKLNNSVPDKVNLSQSFGDGIVINASNLPLLSPKFSLRTNIMYFHSLYSYNIIGLTNVNGIYKGDDNKICSVNNIRIPLRLTYKFSYKKLSPLVSLGLTANIRYGFKEYNTAIVNYVTESFDYKLGMEMLHFGLNSGLGLEYLISPKLAFNLGFEFEYVDRFFGTYNSDLSFNLNYLIHTSIVYIMK